MLLTLWTKTQVFLERFWGHKGGNQNIAQCLGIFHEEVGELRDAVLAGTVEESCHEAADVVVTIIQMLLAKGAEYWELEQAIRQVIEKNDRKSADTHQIDENGKIRRIE